MAADNTYYYGTDQARAARPELAQLASRWLAEFGLGPDSKYIAVRACAMVPVDGSGRVSLDTKLFQYDADLANQQHKRPVGQAFGTANPAQQESYNVNPVDFGQRAQWDDNDDLLRSMSMADKEAKFTVQALNRTLQGMDRKFLTDLTAASTPFDATDVDCVASPWSGSTTDIVDQIENASLNYDGDFDAVILDRKSFTYFRHSPELVDRYGGNVGAGTLSVAQALDAWGTFGVQQVFICDTNSPLGDKVVFFRRGTANPDVVPSGLLRAVKQQDGMDEYGFQYFTGDIDERRHYVLAPCTCDFVYVASMGVRLTNVY